MELGDGAERYQLFRIGKEKEVTSPWRGIKFVSTYYAKSLET